MKATSVSSASLSQAMRLSQARMQSDLVKAQKEVSTGKVADLGLALGTRTSQAINFSRDLDRLNSIIDSNALVSSRLTATQNSLGQLGTAAQSFLSSLTGAVSGDFSSATLEAAGKSTMQAMVSILNTSVNGEYLFAGTNTDVKPMDDFTASGSASRAAFENVFQGYFGFSFNDPAAAGITTAQMNDFITNAMEPEFMGSGWQASWSSATDQPIVSRIALNETLNTSVSANNTGVQKLAMAAAMVTAFLSSNVSQAARNAVIERSVSIVGEAIGGLGQTQSELGIAQKRVSDASDRMNTQVDLFERHILDLEGVDPYQAATRVSDLMQHIETSFALTARIQKLSLLNFLT